MVNQNILVKTGILLAAISILGCDNFDPLNLFRNQNVKIASGVSFDTKKLIAIDPISGKEIQPCGPLKTTRLDKNYQISQKNQQSKSTNVDKGECNTKFVINEDSDPLLSAAIKSSLKPISGQVIRDGEVVNAKYVVVVKALYPGSHCEADTSSGILVVNCPPHRRR